MKLFTALTALLLFTGCLSKGTQKEATISLSQLNNTPLEEVESQSHLIDSEDEDFIVEIEDDSFESPDLKREISSTELRNEKVKANFYEVQEDETLMLISWKLYGDYKRWKELKTINSDILISGHSLQKGMKLFYYPPEFEFKYSPEGSPYLIRRGDTLGKISHKVYEDKKHWQAIWYNNRDLIRDPNLIFAGFTLYYKDFEDINQREIASKLRLFKKQK